MYPVRRAKITNIAVVILRMVMVGTPFWRNASKLDKWNHNTH